MAFDPIFLHLLVIAVSFVVVFDALLSWVLPNVKRFPRILTHAVAGPLRAPFSRLFPPSRLGGIDVSHLMAFACLNLLARLLPLPT